MAQALFEHTRRAGDHSSARALRRYVNARFPAERARAQRLINEVVSDEIDSEVDTVRVLGEVRAMPDGSIEGAHGYTWSVYKALIFAALALGSSSAWAAPFFSLPAKLGKARYVLAADRCDKKACTLEVQLIEGKKQRGALALEMQPGHRESSNLCPKRPRRRSWRRPLRRTALRFAPALCACAAVRRGFGDLAVRL